MRVRPLLSWSFSLIPHQDVESLPRPPQGIKIKRRHFQTFWLCFLSFFSSFFNPHTHTHTKVFGQTNAFCFFLFFCKIISQIYIFNQISFLHFLLLFDSFRMGVALPVVGGGLPWLWLVEARPAPVIFDSHQHVRITEAKQAASDTGAHWKTHSERTWVQHFFGLFRLKPSNLKVYAGFVFFVLFCFCW